MLRTNKQTHRQTTNKQTALNVLPTPTDRVSVELTTACMYYNTKSKDGAGQGSLKAHTPDLEHL